MHKFSSVINPYSLGTFFICLCDEELTMTAREARKHARAVKRMNRMNKRLETRED